jgi:hypothetical protein
VAGVGVDSALAALGLAIGGVAAATVPLAAGWMGISVALGRAQQRRGEKGPEGDRSELSIPASGGA